MATYRGTDGVIKSGANVIVATGFDVSENAAVINDNALSDEWDTHLVGRKSWNGTISANTDVTGDTTGQGTLTIGSEVNLTLYPEEDAVSNLELTGTATITGVQHNSNHDNTVAGSTFTFTGNGELTVGTKT